ncbi:MAG: glycoside hydrolase family 92 protein [Oscillospiraceae bacterium]|nr:glycoside hydrolase family 92 protein [Oscillospiraceae bacterium]
MDYCAYADVFHGCGEMDLPRPEGIAATWFFIKAQCGNTSPSATLPFGKMSAGPFSGGYPTGYGDHLINCAGRPRHFAAGRKLLGFSHLCHSGTGAVGYYYNYAVVTPHAGKTPRRGRRFAFTDERGEPGYYATNLEGVSCELTVDPLRALHRYLFPAGGGVLSVDFTNVGLTEGHGKSAPEHPALHLVDGRTAGLSGTFHGVKLYLAARCFSPCSVAPWRDGERLGVDFTLPGQEALLAVAFSARGMENAVSFLGDGMNFDCARKSAYRAWNDALSRVEIDAPDEQKRIFYSNLYHSLVKPCDWGDDGFPYGAEGDVAPLMTDFITLWDMYKTQLPLVFALYREPGRRIAETLLRTGETLGFLPNSLGLSDNYAHEDKQARMLGAYALLSACHMGLVDDPRRMLRVIEQDVFSPAKRDFTEEHRCASHTWTLDMADACAYAAWLAEALGEAETARRLAPLGKLWATAYSPATGLLSRHSSYYEGTLYNYSFRPCAYMDERIALCGGPEGFARALDKFFGYGARPVKQPVTPAGVARGIRLGRFEGYNNEPDMETPYSYIFARRHNRTCEVVAAGRKYMFAAGRGGLPGNNDSGGLSSCYIWNVLGLFPVAGRDLFLIGTPGVEAARLALSSGKSLEIAVKNPGAENIYVRGVRFNGRELPGFMLPARELMAGGKLAFEMSR